VAQKNLTVLAARKRAAMLTLAVSGLQRTDKTVILATELGGELDASTLASLGLRGLRPARKPAVEVGLDHEPRCVGDKDPMPKGKIELRVPRGTSAAVYVTVRAKNLAANEYQLIQIVEQSGDKVLGGLGLVVISEKTDGKEEQS
jgi:hypothetical protein